MTDDPNFVCQVEGDYLYSSARRPAFLFGPTALGKWVNLGSEVLTALRRTFRERGLLDTGRKSVRVIGAKLQQRFGRAVAVTPALLADDEIALGLEPGDWVQVKSRQEILATLDERGKLQGLAFTREMQEYCGQRHRVFKRLDGLFNEYTRERRRVKNTVLLDGVYCRGSGFGCDRSCFHFWREAWLTRVPVINGDQR